MKNRVFYALLGIALAAPVAAFAGEPNTNSQSGHYEWRQSPNYGPRAPSMSPRRVWVPDAPQMANCNCPLKGLPRTLKATLELTRAKVTKQRT